MAWDNDGWTELPEDWTFDVTVKFHDPHAWTVGWLRGFPYEVGDQPERWWVHYPTPNSDPTVDWTWPSLEEPVATVSEGLAKIIERHDDSGSR